MPTYQYHCNDCAGDFEIQQKFTDAALTSCPQCEGDLRKVFSAVGVVFKGSGFYATDNRTKGKTNAATSTGDSASAGDGAATGSAEASTATKAAPTPAASSKPAATTSTSPAA